MTPTITVEIQPGDSEEYRAAKLKCLLRHHPHTANVEIEEGDTALVEELAELEHEQWTHYTDRINGGAFRPLTLDYPRLRPGILRRHNQVYHEFPNDTPAMRIPADLDGVVA